MKSWVLKIRRVVGWRSGLAAGVVVVGLFGAWCLVVDAQQRYESLLSVVVYDRHGEPLSIAQNTKGHYVYEATTIPKEFTQLVLKKEDTYFLYHPGINPISSARAVFGFLTNGRVGGSSTITQQLAKNILGTETERTVRNKLLEVLYAVSLELFLTKEEIFLMYSNVVYMGNQVQGFATASRAYFDTPLEALTHSEQMALLATLSYPTARNPWQPENRDFAKALNARLSPEQTFVAPEATTRFSFQQESFFELRTAGVVCDETCTTTLDNQVTMRVREIVKKHVQAGWSNNVRNAAVVVIDPRNGDMIALVGSPDPTGVAHGNQINMALAPRPIGSTIKPLIYAKGFERGLRPYTIVDDREYKYPIASGFSLYPKNYDGQYRGEVTLHAALSNSLNVPSVKVLEYIGLDTFYSFLQNDLKFTPIQELDSYQYGIALGGLEMDVVTLTHYFTLFPRGGSLIPLRILQTSTDNFNLPPQSAIDRQVQVFKPAVVSLVHAILSDRFTGVNQFGLAGNLNLSRGEYGVKTGTSRDYHDSWVVGYTADFVVGVWLGNSENTALKQVSGSSGAGAIWHDVMEYLQTTSYNNHAPVTTTGIQRFSIAQNDEWGMAGDVVGQHQSLLISDYLIVSIHDGDTFELSNSLTIPIRSKKAVQVSINGVEYGEGIEIAFIPKTVGRYEVEAFDPITAQRERVTIIVQAQE